MRVRFAALLLLTLAFGLPAQAQEREYLGTGRLFVNDALGDGQDRWRSGGYTVSKLRGPAGLTGLPDEFGALMEYRFANRILAPANTVTPKPGDRRYVGLLSLGAYSHFTAGALEVSFGSEMVMAGPMTRVDDFQAAAHRFLGMTPPSGAVRAAQMPNAIFPTMAGEIGLPVALPGGAVLRPFVAGRWGDETFLRTGFDLMIGSGFTGGVTLRDETTGLLYQAMPKTPAPGVSFLLGADVARVSGSAWLPAPAYTLTSLRKRVRAGVHVQGERLSVFYGAAWLGPEFTAQPGGQVVGALQVQLRF